jgi:hypothetical protein
MKWKEWDIAYLRTSGKPEIFCLYHDKEYEVYGNDVRAYGKNTMVSLVMHGKIDKCPDNAVCVGRMGDSAWRFGHVTVAAGMEASSTG